MRVLMLSFDRGFFGQGSSGDVVARHRQYADLTGALDVIVLAGPEFEDRAIAANFRVFATRSLRWRHFQQAVARAFALAKNEAYDLLVTQEFAAPAGAIIHKDLRVPWLVNIHSMFFSWQWLKFSLLNWYLFLRIKRVLPNVQGFRVNNTAIRDRLISWGITAPILIQPTPVDAQRFLQLRKPENPVPKILFVGRFAPEKNLPMLIAAVKNLTSPWELSLAGEGPEASHLQELARRDERIHFLGPKAHSELLPIYREADIFVLPSNTESYGKVLIEAGAAGCALVATATAGAKSLLLQSQAGVLVPVGDGEALTAALGKFLTDKALRKKMAAAARQWAAQFDAGAAAARTVNFWKEIAKGT